MDAQLQQLIELQMKQNQLLERYLWRFRFSLLALLLFSTAISVALGFVIYTQQANAPTGNGFRIRNGTTITPQGAAFQRETQRQVDEEIERARKESERRILINE